MPHSARLTAASVALMALIAITITANPANAQAAKVCMAGTADANCPAIANPVEVVGTISATTLTLANSPTIVCTTTTYGTVKVINGRQYTCRP